MTNMKNKIPLRQLLKLMAAGTHSIRELSRLSGYHSDKIRVLRTILPTCPYDVTQLEQVTDTDIAQWIRSHSERPRSRWHEPDLPAIAKALAARRATREELYKSYLTEAAHLPKMALRTFYNRISKFAGDPDLVLRLDHKPGECMQVDYAGFNPSYIDRDTGCTIKRQLFVSVVGVSALTFAVSTADQSSVSWQRAHVAALQYYKGVPLVWICDRLKAAVIESGPRGRYKLNPMYRALAEYYCAVIRPARPHSPRDKGGVEAAVKLVQAELRRSLDHRPVYSAEELDARILAVVEEINRRPVKRLTGVSRRSVFEEIDRPHLHQLPPRPYEYFEVVIGRLVGRDYAVVFDGNSYSVDHTLAGKEADVHASPTHVMIMSDGVIVAVHARLLGKGGMSYLDEHRPPNHKAMLLTDAERLAERLQLQTETAAAFINRAIDCQIKPHSKRAALETALVIAKTYSPEEVDFAVMWCEAKQVATMSGLDTCLSEGLWKVDAERSASRKDAPAQSHANVRGPAYFAKAAPNGGIGQ